jgi:hypothetical protein
MSLEWALKIAAEQIEKGNTVLLRPAKKGVKVEVNPMIHQDIP